MLDVHDPLLGALLLLIALAAEGSLLLGLLVPGDLAILAVGGALNGPAELALAGVAGLAGCYLGASGGYLLGRSFGPGIRYGRAGRWVGDRRWRRAEALVGEGVVLSLAYFLPVVHALTPVLAGALGVPYRRFVRRAMAGAMAWVGLYLLVGNLAGSAAREHHQLIVPVAAAVAVIVAGVAWLVERIVKAKSPSRSEPCDSAPADRHVAR
ncbi:DedA family protein [Nonomuraea soli]|uniref:Membrane-associated protein n=1 Tax=Nonomuraea soli TaxID=1032476 RepID=A0A7W0CF37_9ACTN|nr:VTT domain-containing protein [Nonomuraea soli]MBA2890010.1 membrane-associated protein [Nonomuraea soli]